MFSFIIKIAGTPNFDEKTNENFLTKIIFLMWSNPLEEHIKP